MHAKQKGNIGELKVATRLSQEGYAVFREFGDLSKIDLIAVDQEHQTIRIQVKYVSEKNGRIHCSFKKSGPNYKFVYDGSEFDVMAIYCPELDDICYISSNTVKTHKTFILRTDPNIPKTTKTIRMFSDYKDIKKALRDYTGNSLMCNDEGDEIVQTDNNQ